MLQLYYRPLENNEVCLYILTWELKDLLHRTTVCKATCVVSFRSHIYVSLRVGLCVCQCITEKENIWRMNARLNSGIAEMMKSRTLTLLCCVFLYYLSYFYNKLVTFGL